MDTYWESYLGPDRLCNESSGSQCRARSILRGRFLHRGHIRGSLSRLQGADRGTGLPARRILSEHVDSLPEGRRCHHQLWSQGRLYRSVLRRRVRFVFQFVYEALCIDRVDGIRRWYCNGAWNRLFQPGRIEGVLVVYMG